MTPTGQIKEIHSVQEALELAKKLAEEGNGPLVHIPPEDLERLKSANRETRVAWHKTQTSYNFNASKEERNAAKAQRRKRAGK